MSSAVPDSLSGSTSMVTPVPRPASTPPARGGRSIPPARSVSAWQLARAFALVGLTAFGGVMPWFYRMVVEKEKWLDKTEFMDLWSMGMILPGATSTNIAAMIGYRLGGLRGAGGAVGGLLAPSFVIVIGMASLYHVYGTVAVVHGAVRGITAVAAGLVLATAFKSFMSGQQRKLEIVLFGSAAFIGMSIIRLPLLQVVGLIVPLSLVTEWRLGK